MTTTISRRRAPLRLVVAALAAAAMSSLTVAPAHAAAFRFWGYYQLADGKWSFAQTGPDQNIPKDGAVEGWRYALGEQETPRYPRAVVTFEHVCSATPAQAGSKRVALVVDYGRPVDAEGGGTPPAPVARCAVVKPEATSTEVLKTAGELRIEKALICAVANYPATGCGGVVDEPSAEAKAPDTPIQLALPDGTTLAPSGNEASPTTTTATTATKTAASTPSAAGTPSPSTQGTSSGSSTAAYVIAALALLALIAFLVLRARSAAARNES